jgi:aspartyl-tRNA(Asn)/glutamyl-tRNA(Gln) amidotransferase subunit B
LRKKETEEDYRYFPDPDIPPVLVTKEMIEGVRKEIPELPRQKSDRFVSDYGIKPDDAWILVSEIELANLFESMSKELKGKEQAIASWIRGPLKKQLNYRDLTFKASGLSKNDSVLLFKEFSSGFITDDGMEKALIEMLDKKISYSDVISTLNLGKINDSLELEEIVNGIIAKNPKPVEDYKAGNEKSLNFLVGQVVKETEGRADSKAVKEIIIKKIKTKN